MRPDQKGKHKMLFQIELLARDRQAKLLEEAAESRMRRLANGVNPHSVHTTRRVPRLVSARR
jgi:hypothetical protein